jgi:galactokinase
MNSHTSIIADTLNRFKAHYTCKEDPRCFFSPGRVNLIGEHIDYNGGHVFPAALTVGIYCAFRGNRSGRVRLCSADFSEEVTIDLSDTIGNNESQGWANYPLGVIKYCLEAGADFQGGDFYFTSTLPGGAGLSSSAALEVLTGFIVMGEKIQCDADRANLAVLCQRVENNFIGVNCGIMDQFSIALGKKNMAMLLDTEQLNYEYARLSLKPYSLVVMNSNKARALADSKYNERRKECAEALKHIQMHKDIISLTQADAEDCNYIKNNIVRKRARHVISEEQRVLQSFELLNKGDMAGFGRKLTASHISLRDDYEVTGPELDALVNAALSSTGCIGARMTGAGFGGCAIALVHENHLSSFISSVSEMYRAETGRVAEFYPSDIGDGVREILP